MKVFANVTQLNKNAVSSFTRFVLIICFLMYGMGYIRILNDWPTVEC